MPRKLILPAEIKVCATCSYWDGARTVDPELRVVVVRQSCRGECMVKEAMRRGLNDVRGEADCTWDHIAPDEPGPAEDSAPSEDPGRSDGGADNNA